MTASPTCGARQALNDGVANAIAESRAFNAQINSHVFATLNAVGASATFTAAALYENSIATRAIVAQSLLDGSSPAVKAATPILTNNGASANSMVQSQQGSPARSRALVERTTSSNKQQHEATVTPPFAEFRPTAR